MQYYAFERADGKSAGFDILRISNELNLTVQMPDMLLNLVYVSFDGDIKGLNSQMSKLGYRPFGKKHNFP